MQIYGPSTFSCLLFCFTLLLSCILFCLYFVFEVCIAFFYDFFLVFLQLLFMISFANNLKLPKEMNHQAREDPLQNKTF